MTFTAKSCSHWIGRLLTGQVFVLNLYIMNCHQGHLKKLRVQNQFLVLLIWSSSLKCCFLSASKVYLKKTKSSGFFNTQSSCWNRVWCFLIYPSVNKISHDQSTNRNWDKKRLWEVSVFNKDQNLKHLGLESGSWISASMCVYTVVYTQCVYIHLVIKIPLASERALC